MESIKKILCVFLTVLLCISLLPRFNPQIRATSYPSEIQTSKHIALERPQRPASFPLPSPTRAEVGVVGITTGAGFTLGLLSDGTVAGVGHNNNRQLEFDERFQGIIKIVAGSNHSVGLTFDGRVVACGSNGYRECETTETRGFSDIVSC